MRVLYEVRGNLNLYHKPKYHNKDKDSINTKRQQIWKEYLQLRGQTEN